jgi:hypothetical protein
VSTQKDIPAEKERLLAEIKDISDNRSSQYGSDVRTLSRFAELLSVVSDEQAASAAKVERQTGKLITLTWGIVILTFALLVFTIVLYKDTHTLVEHETLKKYQALQNPQLQP